MTKFWINFSYIVLKDTKRSLRFTNVIEYISILMEFAIYSFLFLILFLGVLFNLKITNSKRVNEIRNKLKKNSN